MGLSNDLQEECNSAILHDNVKIWCLMVYSQHVEESRAKRKNGDAKSAKSFDSGSSKGRL